jgi:hypothetical protein
LDLFVKKNTVYRILKPIACRSSKPGNSVSPLPFDKYEYQNPNVLIMLNYRCFSLFSLLLTSLLGCSEIPENHDPVIGIWSQTKVNGSESLREEWIFNDVYLGRYQQYESDVLVLKSDFSWEVTNGVYTISYPGLARAPEKVKIINNQEVEQLQTLSGQTLALRE